ncbi:hypothetical protein SATMO3_07390 [Sporomusa aerivorans]
MNQAFYQLADYADLFGLNVIKSAERAKNFGSHSSTKRKSS